ncbi:MAG: transferase [SAR86 cluster bacterium]|uniref:Chloramphenicol acetyltransferase n=1 Tax=SAR86 cluster bacterium TaxID=2030880 RepID=A0A2A5AW01_9GAMM|nr:MAG: transferase [SAR86 cluster bacterium]
MANLFNYYEKFKAKRLGVKIQDFGNISVDSHLIMEENSRLGNVKVRLPERKQPLTVGAYSYVRGGSEISHIRSIGRFCSIGHNVVLGQAPDNHPISWVSTSMSVSKNYIASCEFATIGHDVWIAHDVVIMAGVNIGNGAVIGRNAVVTKDVEPYQIVVGNPAKVVKTRFPFEQIGSLLKSRWWELDFSTLGKLPFDDVDQFLDKLPEVGSPAIYRTASIKARKVSVYTK